MIPSKAVKVADIVYREFIVHITRIVKANDSLRMEADLQGESLL